MPGRPRRTEALTRERITGAAIDILDADGPDALTFRTLAAALRTGSGAIYHHVAGKQELLATAVDGVLSPVLAAPAPPEPRARLRELALRLFDAIDAHPWIAPELGGDPRLPADRLVTERIGAAVMALNPPAEALFDAASAVHGYILGAARQNAANAQARGTAQREVLLGEIAADWSGLDADEFPFLRAVAASMADHDDRAQFLAGLDLILSGIDAL
ncbi:TetR family transcriptional regulator [Tsukamurella serpentis]